MKTLIILALTLTGCGSLDTSALQSAQTGTETGSSTGTGTDTSPATASAPEGHSAAPTAPKTATVPTTTVAVAVSVRVTTGDAPLWLYVPDLRQWQDAQDGAPAGYHLPSRTELLDAFDRGDLAAFKAPQVVWTTTAAQDADVWTIRLSDGLPEIQWSKESGPSLYARD